ncbi:MAG: ABC transporter ATP-binding protein [Spirochaetales bacterium]|nr:ABC transporter ATP-binding protein [Spirochaetales bacterium]
MENKLNIEPKIDNEVFHNLATLQASRISENVRPNPILEAKNLTKQYGDHLVLPDLSFKIDDIAGMPEVISLLGPSGCGKSTLLRLIAGLEQPSGGELFMGGVSVSGPSQDRGMVFQKYSSFPFLNVLDNIAYPLIHVKKKKRKEAQEIAKYWVDRMYLTGAEKKYPSQLSGGMQQRVAIARSLSMDAKILLMDEPFGALDRKIRWEMQDLMAELLFYKPSNELTVIIVTHDIAEAVFLGDRIWVMQKGNIVSTTDVPRPEENSRIMHGKNEFVDIVNYFNDMIFNLEVGK